MGPIVLGTWQATLINEYLANRPYGEVQNVVQAFSDHKPLEEVLAPLQAQLDAVSAERDEATAERDRLKAEVERLKRPVPKAAE